MMWTLTLTTPRSGLGEFFQKKVKLLAQACEETNALLVFITQTFIRGSNGKCTKCGEAEGDHLGRSKYCYVSTTSPCPPPHVYGFVLLSDACLFVS